MRIVSWNIRQGGGKRFGRIIEQIEAWNADVVSLSEYYSTPPSQSIANALNEQGLVHQVSTLRDSEPVTPQILLASRHPLANPYMPDHRSILSGTIVGTGQLFIAALYVPPQSPKNRAERSRVLADAVAHPGDRQNCDGLAFGDINNWRPPEDGVRSQLTAKDISWFGELENVGWRDLWRHHNPSARYFTWWANSSSGFRCDQVFGTDSMRERVRVQYDWGVGDEGSLSDHAAIVIDVKAEK